MMDAKFTGLTGEQLAVLGAAQLYKGSYEKLRSLGDSINPYDKRAYAKYLNYSADVEEAMQKLSDACCALPEIE